MNRMLVALGDCALAVNVNTIGVPEFSATVAGEAATLIVARSSFCTTTLAEDGAPSE